MQPKDLKVPFTWDERMPFLQKRVFHIPRFYPNHHLFSFPEWNDAQIFGNQNPVCIEFCSGNGDWVAEKAKAHPEKNWVAVEMRFDRVKKICSKVDKQDLKNLFIVCGEAQVFAKEYLKDACVEEIYINFPDPWPKRRHGKHRLVQPTFVKDLMRILKKGKICTFVTDERLYLNEALSVFLNLARPVFEKPFYKTDCADYGSSWFHELWKQEGKTIYYTQFERCI